MRRTSPEFTTRFRRRERGFVVPGFLKYAAFVGFVAWVGLPNFEAHHETWTLRSALRDAADAMETWGQRHGGRYDGITMADLVRSGYAPSGSVELEIDYATGSRYLLRACSTHTSRGAILDSVDPDPRDSHACL